jgi:peroxiredoxin
MAAAGIVFALITAYLFLSDGDEAEPVPIPGDFASETASPRATDLGALTPDRPEVGEPAPDFALVDARDGQVRKLSDFRGRVVVVNWYASWCGPCKREIPEFNAMLAAVGESSVIVLGVDYQESASTAVSTLDDLGATYPALLDEDGGLADHYRVGNRLPSSFFVDPDGVLRSMQIGELTAEQLSEHLATTGISYTPAN